VGHGKDHPGDRGHPGYPGEGIGNIGIPDFSLRNKRLSADMKKVRVDIRMSFFFMPINEPKAHGALFEMLK
jgi:hypothetical protein